MPEVGGGVGSDADAGAVLGGSAHAPDFCPWIFFFRNCGIAFTDTFKKPVADALL